LEKRTSTDSISQIHKEKEMVSFRKSILALAVLALFVGLASAQVGVPPAGASALNQSLACSANVAVPPQLRAEGVTELIGDIVISCTGGFAPGPSGTAVPTANITVSLGTNVTSRLLSGSISEALLLIDEPGSGLGGPGPLVGQNVCSNAGAGTAAGAGVGGCGPLYYNPAATIGAFTTGAAVSCTTLTGATCTGFGTMASAPNVFQGVVSGNQVTFNGIPVLAPITAGATRVFRITNVRANAAGIGSLGLAGTTPLNASIAISGSTSLPVNNPVLVTGFIQNGLGTSIRNSGNSGGLSSTSGILASLQCANLNSTGTFPTNGISEVLRYSENFATAFKTRVAPTATYSAVGLGSSSVYSQNIPGNIYNSESGFILNTPANAAQNAGLSDFGTRLRAVFTNIPAGVSVFVTTTNFTAINANNGTFGGNTGPSNIVLLPANTSSIAMLVQSETAPDFSGLAPFINPTNSFGGTAVYQVPLTPGTNGNSGEAVWEVVSANPNVSENFDFGIYFQYTANPGGGSPAIGSGKVNMSFAPAPGLPGTSPSSSYTAASTGPVPRFVDNSTASTAITISTCQTDLLFPFVTNENGFETGMSIANTTTDPFGTGAQNGSCYIQFYGDNVPATNTTTTAPCTSAGACTGALNTGKVFASTLSSIIGTGSFQGYAIAVCNFQLAHGFAFISDTHATNLAMGYLAIVLNNGVILGARGNAINVPPAEGLAH
jgi:hypothetical protein